MRFSAFIFLMLWALPNSGLMAQPSQATKDAWQLVPPDGVCLVTVQVKNIVKDESMRMMPWEVISASMKEQLGIDPLSLERIDVVACAPGVAIRAGGLLTFQQDIPEDFLQRFQKQDAKANRGVELYGIPGNVEVVMHKKDKRHLLIGTKPFLMAAVKTQPGDGTLRQMASSLGEPGAISMVMAVEPIREVVSSFVQSPPIPGPLVTDIQTIIGKADMLAVRFNLGPVSSMGTLIQTKSPADATEVSDAVARLVKQGTQAMVASVQQQMATGEGRLPQATLSYLQRLAPEIESSTTFKVNGNRMVMMLDGNRLIAGQIAVGAGLLLPAIQQSRTAARRMQSSNNLKQMMLAILNFESAYKRLAFDKDIALDPATPNQRTPGLSWRVQILPYIEQVQLYNEFHLEEPWDSPHNIKLLERMPETFRHPQSNAKRGYTVYQQPTGEGLIQTPGQRVAMRDVIDGTSNTICILETKDEAAVPWTKPGDINPLEHPELLRNDNGMFGVALVDGSVQNISVRIDPAVLKALLTRAGGETASLR